MNVDVIAKVVCESRFTQEEKDMYRKIIQRFVKLYYDFPKQTWEATKWRGVHTFKAPTDMWIYQELIHEIRPDVIIETGTCCGGSALFMADVLRSCGLDQCAVLSIDIDSQKAHEKVKSDDNIKLLIGSSVDEDIVGYVKDYIDRYQCKKVMVVLDSDHGKEHVLRELELYAPLVTPGSILIVEDTIINGHPVLEGHGPGPLEAIEEWHIDHPEFEVNTMCEKYMLTFNRGGYLERKG